MPEVTVRYFASARAAAGVPSETLVLPDGASVADAVDAMMGRHSTQLSTVLAVASLLLNGGTVRTRAEPLDDGAQLDVLPPFAGG